jgi:hypothetical protein
MTGQAGTVPRAKAPLNKSFLVLFCKKEPLLPFLPLTLARFGKVADILPVAGLTGTLGRAYMGGPCELGNL